MSEDRKPPSAKDSLQEELRKRVQNLSLNKAPPPSTGSSTVFSSQMSRSGSVSSMQSGASGSAVGPGSVGPGSVGPGSVGPGSVGPGSASDSGSGLAGLGSPVSSAPGTPARLAPSVSSSPPPPPPSVGALTPPVDKTPSPPPPSTAAYTNNNGPQKGQGSARAAVAAFKATPEGTGEFAGLPEWKVSLLMKKKKEQEEERKKAEAEQLKYADMPEWKKSLMLKKLATSNGEPSSAPEVGAAKEQPPKGLAPWQKEMKQAGKNIVIEES